MCCRVLRPAIILALLTASPAHAQQGVPGIAAGDLPAASIVKESAYEGKALYGYIDGGAEIFFEYGFRRAVVQDIVSGSVHIRLEAFEMDAREAAAGIYSVSSLGCSQNGDPWSFTCTTRFQVQRARGRYFLRAANTAGTPEEGALSRAVVDAASSKIADSTYAPPALFRDTLFRTGDRRFLIARGPLGLENGLDEWRDLAAGAGKFSLDVLVQESQGKTTTTALLEFGPEEGNPFDPDRWEEAAPPGCRRIVARVGPRRLILCETQTDLKTAEEYRATIERYRDAPR